MKNSFGQSLTVTLFGESHGAYIGAVLDGLASGIAVDEDYIAQLLTLRRPAGRTGTARREADRFQIVSGVFAGRTTGTPLCILIPNENTSSKDYAATRSLARPGHADYTAFCKYHGFEDYRGGGHFSGRLTAALVAAGAIVLPALRAKGIRIGTHVLRCAGMPDRPFADFGADIDALADLPFAVLDADAAKRMQDAIEAAADDGDSVGGVLETAVVGMPAGGGEPWFDTVEGVLSHALFGIPAVKGVQFGDAFDMADARGSAFTNHNGGVNGGITNGMPILFRTAVKPTPSIGKTQKTVNFETGEDTEISVSGRHDPAIIHRARIVADCVAALTLYDLLAVRFGTDWFTEEA